MLVAAAAQLKLTIKDLAIALALAVQAGAWPQVLTADCHDPEELEAVALSKGPEDHPRGAEQAGRKDRNRARRRGDGAVCGEDLGGAKNDVVVPRRLQRVGELSD